MSDIRITHTDGSPAAEEFVSKMREWENSYNLLTRAWIAELRAFGVKAARPEDGWVDRKNNMVCMLYCDFNDGAGVGDLVALGDHKQHRIVRITGIAVAQYFMFAHHWLHFEEVPNGQG